VLNILVISAHPDDEVLGMGGTIKKNSQRGNEVYLCVVSEGASAQYSDKKMIKVRQNACIKASKILGISDIFFLDFPDMCLDTIPHLELNKKLEKIMKKIKPQVVFTTPYNDLNKDHKILFESTLVVTRPLLTKVDQLLCYELPGLTKNSFQPNVYINIEKEFSYKIKALKCYKSEIKQFPHPRSIIALESLAKYRGVESGLKKAESFYLVKQIHRS